MYFLHRGCVCTLRTLYIYATAYAQHLAVIFFIARQHTDAVTRDSDIAYLSVRPSVRPLRSGILRKRLNVLSYFFTKR